jgi:hypothetical protein
VLCCLHGQEREKKRLSDKKRVEAQIAQAVLLCLLVLIHRNTIIKPV